MPIVQDTAYYTIGLYLPNEAKQVISPFNYFNYNNYSLCHN